MCNSPSEQVNTKEAEPKRKTALRRVKKGLLIALIVLLSLVVLLVGTFAVLYFSGRSALFDRDEIILQTPESLVDGVEDDGDTVLYNGKSYRFNENVLGILVMGVDKDSIQQEGGIGTNGQADTLLLAAIDTVTGKVNIIPISRDTMVEVERYSQDGSPMGSQLMQLCLAYSYADDSAKSCQNVCRSVSRLLYGAPVDSYIAIDMEGVGVATDMLGGVTLTTLEEINYTFQDIYIPGNKKVTLRGENALGYIRYRSAAVDSNNLRMRRQKQFFTTFVEEATRQLKADVTKLGDFYSTLQPYVVSDLDLSKITYLASTCLLNRNQLSIEFLSIEGEMKEGEKQYAEFRADPQSVYETVLTAFYEEVTE